VAVAVGWQRDTRRATQQDYDRSARLCCVWLGHMEQPSRRTADFVTVFSDVCEKKLKVIYSAASASEDFCLTGAINTHIHSFNAWLKFCWKWKFNEYLRFFCWFLHSHFDASVRFEDFHQLILQTPSSHPSLHRSVCTGNSKFSNNPD